LSFPHTTRAPITWYDITVERDGVEPIKWKHWATSLQMVVPVLGSMPDVDATETRDGWYFLDEKAPLVLDGRYIVLGRRSHTVRAPALLVRRLVHERCVTWLEDYNSRKPHPGDRLDTTPADERTMIQEKVTAELRVHALPSVVETPMVIDTHQSRIYFFDSASPARRKDAMDALATHLCEEFRYTGVSFHEVPLEAWILATRPGAVLPAKIGAKFLRWLAQHALRGGWCVFNRRGSEVALQLTLDRHVTLTVDGGLMHVDGPEAVKLVIEDLFDPDTDSPSSSIVNAIFTLGEAGRDDASWSVKLTRDGTISRCIVNAPREPGDNDRLPEKTLHRLRDFLDASDNVTALWNAFNSGPVQEWIGGEPQKQLFPGQTEAPPTWREELDGEVVNPDQAALFEPQEEEESTPTDLPTDTKVPWGGMPCGEVTNGRSVRIVMSHDDEGVTYGLKNGKERTDPWPKWRSWLGADFRFVPGTAPA